MIVLLGNLIKILLLIFYVLWTMQSAYMIIPIYYTGSQTSMIYNSYTHSYTILRYGGIDLSICVTPS